MSTKSSKNPITHSKVVPDKNRLYLVGVQDAIPQWKLTLWVDAEDRIDIPAWPISKDKNGSGTYYYGTDGLFTHYYFMVDSGVEEFKRRWSVRPDVIYRINGQWTIPVLVTTNRRKNVVMYMTPEVVKEYIPYGHTLVFVPSACNYDGDYWTILRTTDYKAYEDKLVVKETSMG